MVQGVGSNGVMFWGDEEGFGGFSADEEFENSLLESLSPNSCDSACEGQSFQAADSRIAQLVKQSNEQAKLTDTLMSLPPLGLALRKSPSLLDLIEEKLIQQKNNNSAAEMNHSSGYCTTKITVEDFVSQPPSEKLKASNFPAALLRIGTWERVSRNEGDLVAKCYFAKRKLVWEFLEMGLKRKVELQWSDIIAIEAVIQENEPGILNIELDQPPTYHVEIDPQPRKHTIWKPTSDFTGGQAPICRRHHLKFPPGALDRHYEKLLQCDSRLLQLSQRPFPSLSSPYFPTNVYGITDFSFNFNAHEPEFNTGMHFSFSNTPSQSVHSPQVHTYEQTTLPCPGYKDSASPISVMDFSNIDEHVSNHVVNNPRMAFWCQGMNNFADTSVRDHQVQGLPSNAPATLLNPAISYPSYNLPTYGEGNERPNSGNQTLSDLESHLFSDSQVPCSDEKYYLARVESFGALIDLSKEKNPASNTGTKHANYGQERTANDNDFLMSHAEHSNGASGYQQQLVSWVPPQASNQNSMMYTPRNNNLMYPSVIIDPMLEDYVIVKSGNEEYSWN